MNGFDTPIDESGATGGSNVAADFFSAARAKLETVLQPIEQGPGSPNIGGQLFEAIYQFGAGRVERAREKAVGAFLMTSEGRKVQAEGTRQTLNQYLPFILVGVAALLVVGYFAGRR